MINLTQDSEPRDRKRRRRRAERGAGDQDQDQDHPTSCCTKVGGQEIYHLNVVLDVRNFSTIYACLCFIY